MHRISSPHRVKPLSGISVCPAGLEEISDGFVILPHMPQPPILNQIHGISESGASHNTFPYKYPPPQKRRLKQSPATPPESIYIIQGLFFYIQKNPPVQNEYADASNSLTVWFTSDQKNFYFLVLIVVLGLIRIPKYGPSSTMPQA